MTLFKQYYLRTWMYLFAGAIALAVVTSIVSIALTDETFFLYRPLRLIFTLLPVLGVFSVTCFIIFQLSNIKRELIMRTYGKKEMYKQIIFNSFLIAIFNFLLANIDYFFTRLNHLHPDSVSELIAYINFPALLYVIITTFCTTIIIVTAVLYVKDIYFKTMQIYEGRKKCFGSVLKLLFRYFLIIGISLTMYWNLGNFTNTSQVFPLNINYHYYSSNVPIGIIVFTILISLEYYLYFNKEVIV